MPDSTLAALPLASVLDLDDLMYAEEDGVAVRVPFSVLATLLSSSALGLPGYRYVFSTTTTAGDPGSTFVRFNNATIASVTAIYLDDQTVDGVDLSTLLASFGSSGLIKFTSVTDPSEWVVFRWTAIADSTGYWTFTVVYQAGTGTFENNDEVQVNLVALAGTGIAGSTGSTDNALLRADGTGGSTVQSSGVIVNDDNEMRGYRGSINRQTGTSYTLATTDCGGIVECANASFTLTLPRTLPKGFLVTVVQDAAGVVTFTPETGTPPATLKNRQSHTKTAGNGALCVLYVSSNSAGNNADWRLGGDTAT